MKSLNPGFLGGQSIAPGPLRVSGLLGAYKGKEALSQEQPPRVLETLCQVAVSKGMEWSSGIEGGVRSDEVTRIPG